MALDVREYWNFDDPAASESAFRDLLEKDQLTHEEWLEVWAQIARTFSLRRDCLTCHQMLDEHWGSAMMTEGRPKGCFELEWGRALRTGGEPEKAKVYFELAAESSEDDIRADALHILAIIADPQEAIRINLGALEFACQSSQKWAQRWEGTLCNNLGWSYFDIEDFTRALKYFEQGLASRIKFDQQSAIPIAKWCDGRCLRAVGNLDDALRVQLELKENGGDGYVDEELGEILLSNGNANASKPYFAKAVELLSDELSADSPRITRMKELAR